MLEPAAPGMLPRAFLRVGGVSVARQQLCAALALGCERVVCLAGASGADIVDLRRAAEAGGAAFHLIGNAHALVALVTANDELIVLADGLFAAVADIAALLDPGQAVLVQPIEQGLAAGFERIDLNHAAGGAMRLPGRLVERLAELPPDCDAVSALQRIALQAGVRQRPLPPLGHAGQVWVLVTSEDEAHRLEPAWIRLRSAPTEGLTPSRWIALAGVRRIGPALLHAGSGAGSLVLAAAVLTVLGIGAGWLGYAPAGLWLIALAWIGGEAAVQLRRIQSDDPPRRTAGIDTRAGFAWLTDAVIVALAGWSTAAVPGQAAPDRYFPALVLVALLRIVPRALGPRRTGWLEDRGLAAALIAAASAAGLGDETVRAAAILLALAGIVIPRGEARLTPP